MAAWILCHSAPMQVLLSSSAWQHGFSAIVPPCRYCFLPVHGSMDPLQCAPMQVLLSSSSRQRGSSATAPPCRYCCFPVHGSMEPLSWCNNAGTAVSQCMATWILCLSASMQVLLSPSAWQHGYSAIVPLCRYCCLTMHGSMEPLS